MIIKIQNKCPERGTKVRLIKLTALFVISLKPLIGSPSVFLSCNCPSSPRYWLCRKMPIILSKIDPRNPSIVIKIIPLKPNSGRAKKDNKRLPTRPATSPGQDTPPDNPLGIALPVKILKTLPLLIIIDIMNFFIKYVGSSPYNAPALLNLLPYIQYEFGLWYVEGGMYNLARGLNKLLEELNVKVNLNTEVEKIIKDGEKVNSIKLKDGSQIQGDIIVSNMEAIPLYKELLDMDDDFLAKLDKFEPACSGLVIHLALKKKYEQLAHHNFFFSKDPKNHFSTIFDKKKMPSDPTLYLVAPTRTDPSQAPSEYENIKILPHIPYIRDDVREEDYHLLKERVYTKLENMGLKDLRENIIFEEILTPFDIREMYYSNKGSIYGVVSDRNKNLGLKVPKQSSEFNNLYFVGGSTNPGGGMPMVVLSGINTAKDIIKRRD